ncbi:hypothetical protein TWF506_008615 [Arthrobotrys conoides]|uniref:Uncharacterized protein n=1 Tax=Arthrobotrys conoides TaxID=74498 RepID=A0AAN8N9L4_9PEZI
MYASRRNVMYLPLSIATESLRGLPPRFCLTVLTSVQSSAAPIQKEKEGRRKKRAMHPLHDNHYHPNHHSKPPPYLHIVCFPPYLFSCSCTIAAASAVARYSVRNIKQCAMREGKKKLKIKKRTEE